ncbi:unnamed protein product [Toxocara canis]|uniref:Transposase n=1 Tax=Toxocara canis TaxID=6265 RepID=A0A183VDC2_TOXCA|nr:unnamed protein product [Toxocara canis]
MPGLGIGSIKFILCVDFEVQLAFVKKRLKLDVSIAAGQPMVVVRSAVASCRCNGSGWMLSVENASHL